MVSGEESRGCPLPVRDPEDASLTQTPPGFSLPPRSVLHVDLPPTRTHARTRSASFLQVSQCFDLAIASSMFNHESRLTLSAFTKDNLSFKVTSADN